MKKIVLILLVEIFLSISLSLTIKAQQSVKSGLAVGTTSTGIVNISNNELKTLDGVTRNIQDQINAKIDTTAITEGSWYSDTEVDAIVDSVMKTVPFVRVHEPAALGPADATTYYFGFPSSIVPDVNATYHKTVVPTACRIVGFASVLRTAVASNENWSIYVRVNNTTDYLLSSTFEASSVSALNMTKYTYNLNIPMSAGDYYELKMVSPVWETNPTGLYIKIELFFVKD